MALKLLQSGLQPLGQFDGLDTEVLNLLGGEVVTFKSVLATSATDAAAYDVFSDGYVGGDKRTVVSKVISSTTKPLMLADEGIAGYGTLFGSVVGGTVGQNTTGAVLGPHTATGSGKVTCWDKPGLYAVSLDACNTNSSSGLQPTNPTLDTGDALYATAGTGLITPVSGGGANPLIGRFVDFETNGSLVSTPNSLISSLGRTYAFAVFYFSPATS